VRTKIRTTFVDVINDIQFQEAVSYLAIAVAVGTGSGSGTGVGVAVGLGPGDGVGEGVGVGVGDLGGSWFDRIPGSSCLPIAVERKGNPIKPHRINVTPRMPLLPFILALPPTCSFAG
jgi:hypothetical protein